MENFELLAFSVLGIVVLVHVILVNITLGTGWICAMARFLGWRRKSADFEIMSRRVLKILIVCELFSGVWGTIITVVLAGFFPTLMAIATDIIFYPILLRSPRFLSGYHQLHSSGIRGGKSSRVFMLLSVSLWQFQDLGCR